jgi:hypothetical protein
MAHVTIRAVLQAADRYQITVTPGHQDVDSSRIYSRLEVENLATRIGADVRWIEAAPGRTRSAELWGGSLPPAGDD